MCPSLESNLLKETVHSVKLFTLIWKLVVALATLESHETHSLSLTHTHTHTYTHTHTHTQSANFNSWTPSQVRSANNNLSIPFGMALTGNEISLGL